MPALNFSVFIPAVESGDKTCTIRAQRKVPIKAGDNLHLFTGMRTSACRRLLPAPAECREVFDFSAEFAIGGVAWIRIGHYLLPREQIIRLARFDGFPDVGAFLEFFLPRPDSVFVGQLIRWQHPARPFVKTIDAIFRS